MEGVEAVQFFPHPGKLDRLAGNMEDRQGSAAAGISIQLGQDHARQRQGFGKCPGCIDGVLPLHGIHYEQGFDRLQQRFQLTDFRHHRLIDSQPSGSIHDHDVVEMPSSEIQGIQRDVFWLLARHDGKKAGTGLLSQHFKLFYGSGTIDIAGNQQHLLLFLLHQPLGQLSAAGGLARSLQAGHKYHGGRSGCQIEVGFFAT